ncbi:hypothetical protein F383_16812 [Gossypium arboreum]|uniref:Uncharacterized protein n=1 Tax=Gossypium arboreum TaxID=29729 RepID=A0A0B0NH81_GOSAR|nr:hypothetical protein F383_16812 [Gossypium arboreum]
MIAAEQIFANGEFYFHVSGNGADFTTSLISLR